LLTVADLCKTMIACKTFNGVENGTKNGTHLFTTPGSNSHNVSMTINMVLTFSTEDTALILVSACLFCTLYQIHATQKSQEKHWMEGIKRPKTEPAYLLLQRQTVIKSYQARNQGHRGSEAPVQSFFPPWKNLLEIAVM